jgi:transcription elongation factor GreA
MSGQVKSPMLLWGYENLEEELKQRKQIDRYAIVQAIEEARAHGDLSENAEYHAAKEKQGMNEARIKILESAISTAEIIDPSTLSGDRVVFGATVTLLDEDDEKVVYQIVGEHESDVKEKRISYTSPLARALIGRSIGDDAEVHTPKGERYYEIFKIDFK